MLNIEILKKVLLYNVVLNITLWLHYSWTRLAGGLHYFLLTLVLKVSCITGVNEKFLNIIVDRFDICNTVCLKFTDACRALRMLIEP